MRERERDSPFQVPPHVLGHEEHFSIAPECTRSKRLHIQVPETPYKTCQVVLSISSRGNWIEKEFIISLFNERKSESKNSLADIEKMVNVFFESRCSLFERIFIRFFLGANSYSIIMFSFSRRKMIQ